MSFLRESTAVLGYRVGLAAAALVADIIIARAFGPTGKGDIAILYLTPVMIAVLATGGLEYSLNYFGHREPKRVQRLFTTAWLAGLTFATLTVIILLVDPGGIRSKLYGAIPVGYSGSIAASIAIIPAEVSFHLAAMFAITVGSPVLFGRMRFGRRMVVMLAAITAAMFFADNEALGVRTIIFGHLTGIIVALVLCLWLVRYRPVLPDRRIGKLLRYGSVSLPGRLAERLQSRVDVLVLGFLGTTAAVGIYTVAVVVAEILYFVSSSTATVLFSRNSKKDGELHRRVVRLMVPGAIVMSAFAAVAGHLLIEPFYGQAFSASIPLLFLLLPGVICMSLIHMITPLLIQRRGSHMASIGQSVGLTANVGLNVWLIPQFGVTAVPIVSSVSYALTFGIMLIYAMRIEQSSLRDFVLPRMSDLNMVRARISNAWKHTRRSYAGEDPGRA